MDGLNLKIDEQPLADAPKPTAGSKLVAALKLAAALRPSKLIRQILFGCFCSMVVGAFMHLPYLKLLILWVCQAILCVFGCPDRPEPVKQKIDVTVGNLCTGFSSAPGFQPRNERAARDATPSSP